MIGFDTLISSLFVTKIKKGEQKVQDEQETIDVQELLKKDVYEKKQWKTEVVYNPLGFIKGTYLKISSKVIDKSIYPDEVFYALNCVGDFLDGSTYIHLKGE